MSPTYSCSVKRRNIRSGKWSKILNTLLFMFSDKVFVIRAGIHKTLIRKANRGDLDQTASSEGLLLGFFDRQQSV